MDRYIDGIGAACVHFLLHLLRSFLVYVLL